MEDERTRIEEDIIASDVLADPESEVADDNMIILNELEDSVTEADSALLDGLTDTSASVVHERPVRRSSRKVVDRTLVFADRNKKRSAQDDRWRELTLAFRNRQTVSGKVVSAVPVTFGNPPKTAVKIIVNIDEDFEFTAEISDEQFFSEKDFKASYKNAGEREQIQRRLQKARKCLGAYVPILITDMFQSVDDDGNIRYHIAGNRLAALEQKMQEYYMGDRPEVQAGDTATAEVLSVGEYGAAIEVLGVECILPTSEISAYRFVSDCNDELQAGDQIDVLVRRIHRDEATGRVLALNVSAAALGNRDIIANTNKMVVGETHSGTVRHYHSGRHIYSVVTSSGALVYVRENAVLNREVLLLGDEVTVVVTEIMRNGAVFGTAKRKPKRKW